MIVKGRVGFKKENVLRGKVTNWFKGVSYVVPTISVADYVYGTRGKTVGLNVSVEGMLV